jgi:DNA-binding response OmpR family regulator
VEATALGVHGYIVKPFPLADLLAAVESSLGQP